MVAIGCVIDKVPTQLLSIGRPRNAPFLSCCVLSSRDNDLYLRFSGPLTKRNTRTELKCKGVRKSSCCDRSLRIHISNSYLCILLSNGLHHDISVLPRTSRGCPAISVILGGIESTRKEFILSRGITGINDFAFGCSLGRLGCDVTSSCLPTMNSSLRKIRGVRV